LALVLYLDAFDGISGDLFLGLLLDLGFRLADLEAALAALPVVPRLEVAQCSVRGVVAPCVRVVDPDPAGERSYREIRRLLARSSLPAPVRRAAMRVVRRLAAAEARLHGQELADVHLHEAGGLDAVAEIVGVCAGLSHLGIEEVHASALPWSSGFVETAHGEVPLPAPAALACLVGAPWQPTDRREELVTPTGAALLGTLASRFGPPPSLEVRAQGFGATQRSLLRGVLGHAATGTSTQVVTIAASVDDLWPEAVPAILSALLRSGALDAHVATVLGKKGRVAFEFVAWARPAQAQTVAAELLRQTGSLGCRLWPCSRIEAPRQVHAVTVDGERVRVKTSPLGAKAEWSDVERYARRRGLPVRTALQEIAARVSRETFTPPRPDPAGPPGGAPVAPRHGTPARSDHAPPTP
jgi:uncharacterized protein (TIGR00299 family) protein